MAKYNAHRAILAALMKYQDTHDLKSQWIKSPVRGARIKEYWLEAR